MHIGIFKNYDMKSIPSNSIVVLLARIFLGGLFVVASLDKITDPQAFANAILQYKVVGPTFAMLTATILPSLELLCGLSLIIGLYPRGCALLLTVMLVGFTILVASALFRGLDISCGCFTQDPNASKINLQKILENCGLIILSVWLLFNKNQGSSLLQLFTKRQDNSV
ncbi:MAG: DoxX family membrane protein [Ignavibacteriae bacterium]|nr:MAG: DoxX family membrane protein [Ignavibacteriota bacterium]